MPRNDDVRAESQPMMFVLASEMEPLGRRSDKAVDKDGVPECPCFHVFTYSYINEMSSFDGSVIANIFPYKQCNSHRRVEGGTA